MRRWLIVPLVGAIFVGGSFGLCQGSVLSEPGMRVEAESAILMEESTGEILMEQNAHKPLPPASVTKMMVMLLAMEALDEGKIKLTDEVVASPEACRMGGSQIWLEPGEVMTVADLLKAICIVSANDASYALAEHLAGSEERFVALMNRRAKELGLKNTVYYNTTGLTSDHKGPGNMTSAYDMAVLARELLKHPKVLQWTGTWLDSVRDGKSYLRNTNNLVRFYQGCDGLKTGFTEDAGFCLVGTAKRDGVRMITVIMKAKTAKIRSREMSKLFNYGFSQYQATLIYPAGATLGKVPVVLGKQKYVNAILPEALSVVLRRDIKEKPRVKVELKKSLRAPVTKGAMVGKVLLTIDGKTVKEALLTAQSEVQALNAITAWWRTVTDFLGQMFVGHR